MARHSKDLYYSAAPDDIDNAGRQSRKERRPRPRERGGVGLGRGEVEIGF